MEREVHVLQHDLLLPGNWEWFCGATGAEKRGWLRDLHKERAKNVHSPNNHPTGQIGELQQLLYFHGFSMVRFHDSAGPCPAGLGVETG